MRSVPAHLYLGGMAAAYLLWLCFWLILGNAAFGENAYFWDQTAAALAAALAAFVAAWRAVRPYSVFMAAQGFGLLLLATSWASYDPESTRSFLHLQPGLPDYSDIAYGGFVFALTLSWGRLGLELWNRQPPKALTKAVFLLLFIGLAAILGSFYYPQYGAALNTMSGRLDAVIAGLEFLVLVIGLVCILMRSSFAINGMVLGTALLVAGDMVYSEDTLPPAGIEAVWMFGQLLLMTSYLLFNSMETELPKRAGDSNLRGERFLRSRSDLSGVLILLSLGGLLLAAGLGLLPLHVVWKAFLAVLFVVALVISEAWLTDRFDDSVQYVSEYSQRLHANRLQHVDWRAADSRIATTLQSTGLGEYLDSLNQSARALKQDVLFLGPERLFPQAVNAGGRDQPSCFIVMPFGDSWSGDVHRIVSAVCSSFGVRPMRGDDVFKPSDFLVDIWQSINSADFVIADITGKNPNVLYELGIAHTLAKPVLIISKNAADIPIDLSTRRAIIYGKDETNWQSDLETKLTVSVREMMDVYSLHGPPETVQSSLK